MAAAVSLDPAAKQLLQGFGFTPEQKREVWEAWKHRPDRCELLAQQARARGRRDGTTGAGLLLTMIHRGDHLLEQQSGAQRVTGYRWIRSTHAGRYVRDASGCDLLPIGYEEPIERL